MMAGGAESETNWDELKPQLIKMALEVGPLVVFFITNARFEIYVGTACFMVAMVISLALSWLLLKRIAVMPLVSGILVLLFFAHIFRFPMGVAAVIGAAVFLYPATRRFWPIVPPKTISRMNITTDSAPA